MSKDDVIEVTLDRTPRIEIHSTGNRYFSKWWWEISIGCLNYGSEYGFTRTQEKAEKKARRYIAKILERESRIGQTIRIELP